MEGIIENAIRILRFSSLTQNSRDFNHGTDSQNETLITRPYGVILSRTFSVF